MEKLELAIAKNQVLRGFCWEIKKPKAQIVIFEGMEEHVSRYDIMAKYYNKKGFSVYALDTFGQGENVDKNLSNIGVWPEDGFNKLLDAFNQLILKLHANGLPVYVFAHSMGSFVGQAYIQKYPGNIDKIVLCGAGGKNGGVKLAYPFAKLFVTKKKRNEKSKILNGIMFSNFNKRIKEPKTAYDWLSLNEDVVLTYIKDPLCGFGPTKGFCLEFLKLMKGLYKPSLLKQIDKNTKILLIGGDQDPVTAYGKYTVALTKMYKKYGIEGTSNVIFEGLRHEIHNEDRKNEVFDTVVSFFNN